MQCALTTLSLCAFSTHVCSVRTISFVEIVSLYRMRFSTLGGQTKTEILNRETSAQTPSSTRLMEYWVTPGGNSTALTVTSSSKIKILVCVWKEVSWKVTSSFTLSRHPGLIPPLSAISEHGVMCKLNQENNF